MDDKTETRLDKKTPHGGAYSIAYWQDDEGSPTTKEKATKVKIIEFSRNGEQVYRTYAELHQDASTTDTEEG